MIEMIDQSNEIKISCLGPVTVELGGRLVRMETRKTTAMLAYLTTTKQIVPRETLTDLFWPETDQRHSRASLRRSLSSINKSLEGPFLVSSGDNISFNESVPLWVDAWEFEGLINTSRNHHHDRGISQEYLKTLEQAVQYYRGDFLSGLFVPDSNRYEEWRIEQVEYYRQLLTGSLEKLSQAYAEQGKWDHAIELARCWVNNDRLNELAHLQLIGLYYRSGKRSAGARQYEDLRRTLMAELGIEPEPTTVEQIEFYKNQCTGAVTFPKDTASAAVEKPVVVPILKTKLYIPSLRPKHITRSRLISLMDNGALGKFVLISAPAGFGKTTVLAEWVLTTDHSVAWISLDREDNDPSRFASYLVEALGNAVPSLQTGIQEMLQSIQAVTIKSILTVLLNRIAAENEQITLILDDYQFITSDEIHQAVVFLLDHIPAHFHLVISTRIDPPLMLSRLRSQEQLTEIRARDLRFTEDETAAFLGQALELKLSSDEIATLEARTEGWAAGLQMAALSLHNREDARAFIQAFSGSNRYIMDYLIEEVLNHKPPEIRHFLLQTSILENLTGPLCDAVTGSTGNQKLIERIEKDNLFLIPLDDQRGWFRYHHLFRELLQYKLEESQISTTQLHLRAAGWYEQNGMFDQAIQHALLSKDYEYSTRLIESSSRQVIFVRGQIFTVFSWLNALPKEWVESRPALSILTAWCLLIAGQWQEVPKFLDTVDALNDNNHDEQARQIQGEEAVIRCMLAILEWDANEVIQQAELAASLIPEADRMMQSIVQWELAQKYRLIGDAVQGEAASSKATRLSHESGNAYFELMSRVDWTKRLLDQGKLHQAYECLIQGFNPDVGENDRLSPPWGHVYITLADILYEWNRLDESMEYLTKGMRLAQTGIPQEVLLVGYLLLAWLELAYQDWEATRKVLREASDLADVYNVPFIHRSLRNFHALVLFTLGDTQAVDHWFQHFDPAMENLLEGGVEGKRLTSKEVHQLTYCRIYIDRYERDLEKSLDPVFKLLDQLAESMQAGGRTSRLIKVWNLRALAHQAENRTRQALQALEHSLSLAEPGGYVRIYIDEGQPMAILLATGIQQGIWVKSHLDQYAKRLFDVFTEAGLLPDIITS